MTQMKPLGDQWFDIAPKTSFEFEMGEKLSKIKAIRGLTPKKDMPIQLNNLLNALLVSKTQADMRFKNIESQHINGFNYLKIHGQNIILCSAP